MGINRYRLKNVFYRTAVCCIAAALFFSLSACGNRKNQPDSQRTEDDMVSDNVQQTDSDKKSGYGTLLSSYGIEAPVSRPGIYVDVAGYVTNREKKAVFSGERHGDVFRVVRRQDNAVVYTGRISEGEKDKQSGQIFSIGDFTSLEEPGMYYIHTDILGQSYSFSIAQDTYENIFLNMLKNVLESNLQEDAQGVCNAAFGMHVIMYALQCNGTLFEAAYEHLEADEQDRQLVTQLLYVGKWLISQQRDNGSLYDDYEATAAFCGIMAMSRDMFGRYEPIVDKEYERAAETAWAWLDKQQCSTQTEQNARFYAAVQLFHEEGSEKYKTIAEDFLKKREKDYSGERFIFYGALSYISAGKGTDRDLCTYIMKDMMTRTEGICREAESDAVFGVSSRSVEQMMYDVLHLSFINYLTPSKEYTMIIENTIQYIGGLNETGTCYIGADGIWRTTETVKGRSLEWNGIMLLTMSDMLKNLSGYNPKDEIIAE